MTNAPTTPDEVAAWIARHDLLAAAGFDFFGDDYDNDNEAE